MNKNLAFSNASKSRSVDLVRFKKWFLGARWRAGFPVYLISLEKLIEKQCILRENDTHSRGLTVSELEFNNNKKDNEVFLDYINYC